MSSNDKTICDKCNKPIKKSNFKRHYNICGIYNNCLYCGSKLLKRYNKFCNSKCAGLYNNEHCKNLKNCKKGPESKLDKPCLNCGSITRNEKFCKFDCKKEYIYKQNLELWKEGKITEFKNFIKKYLLEKYNYKCSICGWDKKHPISNISPLHAHHKDGNTKNNTEDNLDLLCPNCHSLTENFGSRNMGNGKKVNRDYYKIYSYIKKHKDEFKELNE